MSKIDNEIINSIKVLALDMINKAGSGHPGIVLGAAPILYALYKDSVLVSLCALVIINSDTIEIKTHESLVRKAY